MLLSDHQANGILALRDTLEKLHTVTSVTGLTADQIKYKWEVYLRTEVRSNTQIRRWYTGYRIHIGESINFN